MGPASMGGTTKITEFRSDEERAGDADTIGGLGGCVGELPCIHRAVAATHLSGQPQIPDRIVDHSYQLTHLMCPRILFVTRADHVIEPWQQMPQHTTHIFASRRSQDQPSFPDSRKLGQSIGKRECRSGIVGRIDDPQRIMPHYFNTTFAPSTLKTVSHRFLVGLQSSGE